MHRFTLVLEHGVRGGMETGVDPHSRSAMVTAVERDGVPVVELDRDAPTFADAVLDAIGEVEACGLGRVVRVEPDELVSASAIARRLGRSRQSVAQLIAGQRGPGGFPPPAVWIDGKARLWRWTDVAQWFSVAVDSSVAIDQVGSEFLAMLNGELQARRHRERLAALAVPDGDRDSDRFAVELAFPQLGRGRRWRGAAAELGGGAPAR